MELLTERTTLKLKIPGEPLGDPVDTFTLKDLEMERENAESRWLPHIPLLDHHILMNHLNIKIHIS